MTTLYYFVAPQVSFPSLVERLGSWGRDTNSGTSGTDNTPVIIAVPIRSESVSFSPSEGKLTEGPPVSCDGFAAYSLPEEQPLRPVRMEVHDQANVRGDIPARICLLGSNRTMLQTFTLPTSEQVGA